jgi:hypothetical protein
LDKIRHGFLWNGTADANVGHCLVWWMKVMWRKKFWWIGIHDFDLFSRALHLRWQWYELKDPNRP